MILALDPGLNASGCALFDSGTLQRAWLVRPYRESIDSNLQRIRRMARQIYACLPDFERNAISALVGEWPQVYTAGKGKGDPNDLLPLAGVVAGVACLLPEHIRASTYSPRDWKGTTDGDKFTEKIESRLTEEERTRIAPCAPGLRHNVLDAVGIGLKAVGRLEKRRFISRGE